MEGADQTDKADAGDQGKQKNDWGAVEAAFERQGVEQPADGRPGDVGDLEHRGAPGNGVHEMLRGDQVRQERGAGGSAEGAAGADQEQHGEDGLDSMQPAEGEKEQGQGAENL